MFEPKLGVSVHCLSREFTNDLLEAIGASHIATAEVYPVLFHDDRQPAEVVRLRDTLRAAGIRPATVHAPFGGALDISKPEDSIRRDGLASAAAAIELAEALDAPMIVVHASTEPIEPQDRALRREHALRSLAEIGERAKESGRRIAFELLPRTCLGNTVEELLDLVGELGPEIFGVCLDTNHLMDRYAGLADDVRKLGDHLITLHLSDYDGVDEKHWPPGKGVIDWKAFMQALRDIDYQGPFNYECPPDGDTPQERVRSLEQNFEWLSAL